MLGVQGRVVLQCGMPARRLAEPQEALQGLRSGPPGPECRKVTALAVVTSIESFLLVRVALKIRSLRIHPPRLCRVAVF